MIVRHFDTPCGRSAPLPLQIPSASLNLATCQVEVKISVPPMKTNKPFFMFGWFVFLGSFILFQRRRHCFGNIII